MHCVSHASIGKVPAFQVFGVLGKAKANAKPKPKPEAKPGHTPASTLPVHDAGLGYMLEEVITQNEVSEGAPVSIGFLKDPELMQQHIEQAHGQLDGDTKWGAFDNDDIRILEEELKQDEAVAAAHAASVPGGDVERLAESVSESVAELTLGDVPEIAEALPISLEEAKALTEEIACENQGENGTVLNSEETMGIFESEVSEASLGKADHRLIVEEWFDKARRGVENLSARAEQLQNKDVGHDGNIVVIELDCGRVAFITGMEGINRWGRKVAYDKDNGVKSMVCVGSLRFPAGYSRNRIIHPDIGVSMHRRPEDGIRKEMKYGALASTRPKIDPDIVHLKDIWEIATGVAAPVGKCDICMGSTGIGEEDAHTCWLHHDSAQTVHSLFDRNCIR